MKSRQPFEKHQETIHTEQNISTAHERNNTSAQMLMQDMNKTDYKIYNTSKKVK